MTENSGERTEPVDLEALALQYESRHTDANIDDFIGDEVDYDFDAEVIHNGPSILERVINTRVPRLANLPLTATYFLAPNLDALRKSFKVIAPTSDTASDGWIGNYAHCSGCATCCQLLSDHCADCGGMVHAVDKDKDLRSPYGVTMQQVIQFILSHPADRDRLNYMIYNRTIWSASKGWEARAYTGDNPHTEHAHFSGRYEDAIEANRAPWQFEQLAKGSEQDMDATQAQQLQNIHQIVQAMARMQDTATGVVVVGYSDANNRAEVPLVGAISGIKDSVSVLSGGGIDPTALESLANDIANKVIAATENSLTAEDFDGIKEQVKEALREGTAPSA